MTAPCRIVVVGSGRVAEALCRALPMTQVFARNAERGRALAEIAGCPWEHRAEHLAAADLYLIAVADGAIRTVTDTLDFGHGLVAHTCAAAGPDELSPRIARRGVFYPLQTFSEGRAVDFHEVPIFLEAEHEGDYSVLEQTARSISHSVHRSDTPMRQKIHIGAVFVCNFVNALYTAGERWMERNDLDFNLLKPLIAETTQKMLAAPSPVAVQTGPAARGDFRTIERHLQLLKGEPELKNLYNTLTAAILKTHGKF